MFVVHVHSILENDGEKCGDQCTHHELINVNIIHFSSTPMVCLGDTFRILGVFLLPSVPGELRFLGQEFNLVTTLPLEKQWYALHWFSEVYVFDTVTDAKHIHVWPTKCCFTYYS